MPTRPTKTFTTRRSTRQNHPIDSFGNYASLTWDVTLQAYIFRFAFDENFLTMFKQYVLTQNRVPVYANGKFSHWVIAESVFDALRTICEAKWRGRVKAESRSDVERKLRDAESRFRTGAATQPSVDKLLSEFEELVELSIPKISHGSVDDLKRFYRVAATKLHPDKSSGDSSKMARLNYVWKELQKQLKP